ncbi:MAG: TPM domain-containing protein [Candidatus Eremiobacteraeota bacterium]|nr:TPM domain-containing protein [Candidatus Eremiobacteraeota bacterium]
MKPTAALAAFAALTVAVAATVAPAFAARSSYVIDDAHLLSSTAVAQIDQQVSNLSAQTGKEVLVVTTPSLNGQTPEAALERSFAQNQVNGVEIFIAQNEHQIRIAGDRASSTFFPAGSYQTIAQTMRASFKSGDYDGGVENAVGVIVNTYRGHTSSLNAGRRPVGTVSSGRTQSYSNSGGFSVGWIWWIIILAAIFFIIRGIFRAMMGPRMYGGPGYGPGGPGYGPGYGGPGYGMGGGGFWSGLLGGLGGAWLGNELFGGRRDYGGGGADYAGTAGGADPGAASDAGGWQSDAGQIDTSNIGGSSWGDSGGGWGGGDSGGGGWGGGDGGGGGDSGGGW